MIKGKLDGQKPAVYIHVDGYQISDACNKLKLSSVTFENIICLNYDTSYNTYDTWAKELLKDVVIKEEDFDISTYNTYYRYPNINLSRDKMSFVSDKYKIRKVLDPQKADFRVMSSEFISKLSTSAWRNSLSSVKTVRSLITKYPDIFEKQLLKEIDVYTGHLSDEDLVVFQFDSRYNSRIKNKDLKNVVNLLDNMSYGSLNYIKGTKNIDIFTSLFDPNVNYVTDTYMNEITSEDSVILDDSSYKSIRDMLKGNDTDNVAIAMSMMANCNVAKSKTYLGLLFFHFSETLRQGKLWNQVGFKTIKKQFEKYVLEYNHYHSSRYSDCIRQLAEDDALTVSAAEHLINMVFDKVINGNCGINDKNSVFKLNKASITLVDKYAKEVKEGSTISKIVLENTNLFEHDKQLITDDLPF